MFFLSLFVLQFTEATQVVTEIFVGKLITEMLNLVDSFYPLDQ